LEAKVDRHFGAVTGFAGGVNTSRHMAHLCHWLDQTRQQTRIGNAGHVEKSAIGSGATERRLRLSGRGGVSCHSEKSFTRDRLGESARSYPAALRQPGQ